MDGIKSLLQSRKVWLALAGLAGSWIARKYGIAEADANTFVLVALSLAGLIAVEDAAKGWGQGNGKK